MRGRALSSVRRAKQGASPMRQHITVHSGGLSVTPNDRSIQQQRLSLRPYSPGRPLPHVHRPSRSFHFYSTLVRLYEIDFECISTCFFLCFRCTL